MTSPNVAVNFLWNDDILDIKFARLNKICYVNLIESVYLDKIITIYYLIYTCNKIRLYTQIILYCPNVR